MWDLWERGLNIVGWKIILLAHWLLINSAIFDCGIFQLRPILKALSCFVFINWYNPFFPILNFSQVSSMV